MHNKYIQKLKVPALSGNSTKCTEEIDAINSKASKARKSDSSTSLIMSKEAITAAKDAGYTGGLALANLNAGIACRISSDFENASAYFNEALGIYRAINDKKGESRTLNAIANVELNLSNFDNAIEFYEECVYVLQSIGDMDFEAVVLMNKGLAYQQNGNLKAALKNYLESLCIFRTKGLKIHHALYNNLGIVFLETGNYEEALMYFTEALKQTQMNKAVNDEGLALANLGRTYLYMEDFTNAITYLSEALICIKKTGNRQAETQVYANLGKSFRRMKCYPESVKLYNRALKYYKEISDKSSVAHTLCEMGELYFELNDYKSSKEFFNEGLEIAGSSGDEANIARLNTGLAGLYLKFRDTEKAKQYLSSAERPAASRNSLRELMNICKLYSEVYTISGNEKLSGEYMKKYSNYTDEIADFVKECKIQSIMLEHIGKCGNRFDTKKEKEIFSPALKYA